ncbi:MAG: S8 family serine peptidase [Chitinivibrionales bacterium]|nr:S8 family serine peptidase [Chitinivibrionales bacterium]
MELVVSCPEIPAARTSKVTPEFIMAANGRAFTRSVAAIQERLGLRLGETVEFEGTDVITIKLTKAQLLELRDLEVLRSVNLAGSLRNAGAPLPTLQDVYQNPQQKASLLIQALHDHGWLGASPNAQKKSVGVLEVNGINSAYDSHFAGILTKRQQSYNGYDIHGARVACVIRNVTGSGYYGGGAPQATMAYAAWEPGGSEFLNSLAWLRQNLPSHPIINCSFAYTPWWGGHERSSIRRHDLIFDINASTRTFDTYVVGAGFQDLCTDPNIGCCLTLGWTADECNVVPWNGYNSIVVGSADHDETRSYYSPWLNGPDKYAGDENNCYHLGNETPHVAAKANPVETPLDPYPIAGGTSMAAPAITAALACLQSGYPEGRFHPWHYRAFLIAAGTTDAAPPDNALWPSGAGTADRTLGAGVPWLAALYHLSRAQCWGSSFALPAEYGNPSNARYGYFDLFLPSTVPVGAYTTRTINVTTSSPCYMQFVLTWMSSPENVAVDDDMSTADELHLWVSSSSGEYWSHSTVNTTQRVGVYHDISGTRTYDLRVYLITRRNTGSAIRGCVAIVPNPCSQLGN